MAARLRQRFFRHFWQIAAIIYVVAIFILSSIPGLTPPPLGFVWQDKFYHFLEYAVLSLLLYLAFNSSVKERLKKHAHLLTILIGLVYAATDEIHQAFVTNRQGDFWDWVADGVGVIIVQVAILKVQLLLRTKKTDFSPPLSS